MDDKTKVLIVDDRVENLFALNILLKPLGIQGIKAKSGEEALQKLEAHKVKAILLDVNMPGMNGYETADAIRQNSDWAQLPIFFVSAMDEGSGTYEAQSDHGSVEYLYKPIDKVKLEHALSDCI